MIYCVEFSDVVHFFAGLGYRIFRQGGENVMFADHNRNLVIVRAPNVFGRTPEILINEALYDARISPPDWQVTWCD